MNLYLNITALCQLILIESISENTLKKYTLISYYSIFCYIFAPLMKNQDENENVYWNWTTQTVFMQRHNKTDGIIIRELF